MSTDKAPGATSKISLCFFVLALAAASGALGGNGNTTIHVFAANGSEGQHVKAPLVPFNGFLYGIAPEGGQYGHGSIFKVTLDSNHTFSRVYSFTGGTDGGGPLWLAYGGDGNLYFVTAGAQVGPTTFAPGTFGSMAQNETFTFDLHYWATNGSEGILAPGAYLAPNGSGNFVFTAPLGGPHSDSVGLVGGLTASGVYNLVYDFRTGNPIGTGPVNVAVTSDGSLWGSTFAGTINGLGGVFTGNQDGTGFGLLHSFTPLEGGQPGGGITAPSIAKVNPNPSDFFSTAKSCSHELKYGFGYRSTPISSSSVAAYAGVSSANDGTLYGSVTGAPGGALFQFNPQTSSYTKIYQMPAAVNVYASPVDAPDGFLYVTTYDGGNGSGDIEQQTKGPVINSINPTSGAANGFNTTQINGLNFASNATVTVGGASAAFVQYFDPTKIQIVLPTGGTAGTLNTVTVLNGDPIPGNLHNGYLYDFLDVPGNDNFHDFVEKIFRHGITAGIGGGLYGRDNPVRREQMAVFLEKAEHGSDYVPPPCAGVFPDVPCSSPFAPWIEQLAAEGITGGCGGGNFCPTNPVIRQQMAVFLLKTKNGSSYTPPACTGVFDDVPCPSQFAAWIEELSNEGITGGCSVSPPLFCPTNGNTRGQMAVFLVKTFSLQ